MTGSCQVAHGRIGLGLRRFRLEGFVVGLCHGLGFGDRRLLVDGRSGLGRGFRERLVPGGPGQDGLGLRRFRLGELGLRLRHGVDLGLVARLRLGDLGLLFDGRRGLGRGLGERLVPGAPRKLGLGLGALREVCLGLLVAELGGGVGLRRLRHLCGWLALGLGCFVRRGRHDAETQLSERFEGEHVRCRLLGALRKERLGRLGCSLRVEDGEDALDGRLGR